jgi:hypothetical protein
MMEYEVLLKYQWSTTIAFSLLGNPLKKRFSGGQKVIFNVIKSPRGSEMGSETLSAKEYCVDKHNIQMIYYECNGLLVSYHLCAILSLPNDLDMKRSLYLYAIYMFLYFHLSSSMFVLSFVLFPLCVNYIRFYCKKQNTLQDPL